MTCAKKIVTCYLVTPDHEVFIGTNACRRPQVKCPRHSGEGYEKCAVICEQEGHAEEMALKAAGDKARGATAYLHGIGHYCKECQLSLFKAGVVALRLMVQQ